ncbi:DUF3231 family protein [Sporohalobacter salinus]|uniref:DUF3231 family protein n=1 Tax=Sporohalobacter salinus TaxID=1494606 RepID=UPI0019621C8F|nr:DUF3231 family protein [Sporohalobacter salinus]MBM7624457.1 formiminotetrahydrofolate cyclodeaminase [Sporohalobacter salinus]
MSFLENLLGTNKKLEQPHTKISGQEAHHLWNLSQMHHIFLDNIKLNLNFVHDEDFKHILKEHRDYFQNKVNKIENIMQKYSIKSTKPSSKDIQLPERVEIIQDPDIAQLLYIFLRANISVQIKTIKDTIFSDDLRNKFIEFTKNAVDNLDEYIEYLKGKNWIDYPPLYKSSKTNEEVAANEIYHLWEHLNYRYIHIEQTKIYIGFISDDDFKALLNKGLNTLEKQINELEDMLLKHGVTLPTKYPESIPYPKNNEVLGDEYIFNMILNGMQNAAFLHGSSIQEMIVNKQIRNYFKQLLYTEMDLINQLIKYGKVKGWLSSVPKLKRVQE